MSAKTLDEVYSKFFRKQVEEAGGIWVGIQEYLGHEYDLVLFNHPTTGSTLAVRTDCVSVTAVRARLAEHSQQWERARGVNG